MRKLRAYWTWLKHTDSSFSRSKIMQWTLFLGFGTQTCRCSICRLAWGLLRKRGKLLQCFGVASVLSAMICIVLSLRAWPIHGSCCLLLKTHFRLNVFSECSRPSPPYFALFLAQGFHYAIVRRWVVASGHDNGIIDDFDSLIRVASNAFQQPHGKQKVLRRGLTASSLEPVVFACFCQCLPSWAPSLALPRVPFEKASFARLFSFIPYLGQSSWINVG